MIRSREGDDLEPASRTLGHLDRSLSRLGAGVEEERLVETGGEDACKTLCELDYGLGDHVTDEVVELADVLLDDLNDLRVRVAEKGAHLAGGEIKDLTAIGVVEACS